MDQPFNIQPDNKNAASFEAVSSEAIDLTQKTWTVPRLLTQKEASALTRLSEKWFERDRWLGCRVPFVKIGRHVRYRAEDIDAYIKANTRTASR